MENKNHYEEANAKEAVMIEPKDIRLAESGTAKEDKTAAGEVLLEKKEAVSATVSPMRVNEIRELRGKNSKVFRLSDGSEQAVFYAEPIHVFDEETQSFESIDKSLTDRAGEQAIVGGKNTFSAVFSKDKSTNELFSIADKGYKVTVFSKKNSKQKGNGIVPFISRKAVTSVDTDETTDTIIFEEVETGADLSYSLTGSGVKEDIIIKRKADVYRYPFVLHCENVTAVSDESEGSIAFVSCETGDEVFNIPAPFMRDAEGVVSTGVSYDIRRINEDDILLTVTADREWINSEDRVFPVVIDPQINVSGANAMNTYSWQDGRMYSSNLHSVGTVTYGTNGCNSNRMYIGLNLPILPRNPRIKKAELKLYQNSCNISGDNAPKLGLYRVADTLITGICTPMMNSELIDYEPVKESQSGENKVAYTFDITKLLEAVTGDEYYYANLVVKMIDESSSEMSNVVLCGSAYSSDKPELAITYESSYGVNTSYRTHTHELGRFGKGSIDLSCGNLMFESEDFAWAGNRMPVTLRHLYNSALSDYQYTENSAIKLNSADFSAMKLGHGFKLNIMQSMMPTTFQHEGTVYSGYVYIGENGEEAYFKKSDKTGFCGSHMNCTNLYEDVTTGEMLYCPDSRELDTGGFVYRFDDLGRLEEMTDENRNCIVITYTSDRITSVADGAGRVFGFGYNGDGQLLSITAPDNTSILYTYSDNLLSMITYPDGKKASIAYTSNKPASVTLLDADGNNVYKVEYAYVGDRLTRVTEYGVENGEFVMGNKSTYSYSAASGRTIVQTTEQKDTDEGETSDNVIKTVYTFDDDGNIISEYVYSEDTGNTGVEGEGSGIHPYSGNGGVGVVSNINNLLTGHNFEALDAWSSMPGNCEDFNIRNYSYEAYTKFGKKVGRMQSYNEEGVENGIYQATNTLPAGKYTFSTYLRVLSDFSGGETPGAFIRVTDTSGNVLGVSEHLTKYDKEYTRLIVPFELDAEQSVQVQILLDGKGTVYADAAQLENNPYANAYNMLENGNFERETSSWSCSSGVSYSAYTRFNMSRSLSMSGDLNDSRCASQTITVKSNRSTRETFTLSGWAKGYGIVNRERDNTPAPQFRLRAVVKYYDAAYSEYGTETYTADFSPCTEEWQLASVQFSKEKYRTVQNITVYCDYNYNCGSVYFDDIQLVRDSIETDLSASDFVIESTDMGDNDSEGEDTAVDNAPTFSEVKDAYGNILTETNFTDGEFGTIYRSFGFNEDNAQMAGDDTGNNLVRETDARGNDTTYTVDSETSRNEEVTDRCGNKTAYEYDASGRTTKVTSKKADGTAIADVSYAYGSFDNMTEIVRGDGMKYALAYNAYHNLESIGVEGKSDKLIKYTYKNGNGRLKEISYANGDTMKATYNSMGQMVAEKWYNAANTLTAHYKYVYDGQGNIVRSIDILAKIEYTYTYENGRIIRAAEADIELSGEIVVSKSVVNTVKYYYDSEDKLTKKVITPEDGSEQTIYYETTDDNTVVKFTAGGRTVTSHSKTDSFGRKVFDELQLETGFVSRQFSYHAGEITDEHKDNAKLKSSATTQLISQIILSGGRTVSYEYDAEERITKVIDSVDGTTEYTYDELGQLLTETVNGEVVNTMTYDNYGNIISKNGTSYTYGDSDWKDLLTKVGEETVSYDAQGNPTSYLGHTLAWEKGRQLKSFDSNTYTYNANGIRTSKTVNGVKHSYTLDGTKILRETWGDNTLVPMYDNADSVCGITFNNEPFYFQKNLQGDVIAIVDRDAETVASYSYDAWGACSITSDTSGINIANVNPYRYRSYYYDNEIGLYYLQSRYYDACVCRFINADDSVIVGIPNGDTSHNIFAYCENEPVLNSDYQGFFVIRRWMISAIADFLLCLIPGIGGLFAPVKTVAKAYGKASLKSKLAGPLGSFVKFVARNASKLLNGVKNGLSKLWGVGRWLASKIPVGKLTSMLAGLTSSVIINKFLNIIVPNIDIILSLGGLLSGVLDYVFDKSLNNSIWVI